MEGRSKQPGLPGQLRPSVDSATEDGRAFLQARVLLFAKWLFVLAVAFYLIENIPLDALLGAKDLDWVREWFGHKEWLELAIIAVAGVMWIALRTRPWSSETLHRIDGVGVVLTGSLIAGMLFDPDVRVSEVPFFVAELAATNLIVVRAIVIPSSVRRTLVVSILAFAPIVFAIASWVMGERGLLQVRGAHVVVASTMWAAIAIASATVTSRILFRLRSEVSRATKLGHYLLEEEIGRGGMGVVYRARHVMLRRPTAIKLLSLDRNRETDLRRFEREVHWAAKLSHPNSVQIYDYGRTPAGVLYCAMELIDGVTLQELVETSGPVPAGRVVHILRQVCEALEEAHRAGIIHRDVKPANVMLTERGGVPDVVKVLDFGLVKEVTPDTSIVDESAVDSVAGTPAYLSPEAIEDPSSVDARSDLYAVGAVGYFLLTGTRVFRGESVVAMCVQTVTARPERPSARLGADVDADLEQILLSCLEKAPGDRPQEAGALAAAFSSCACRDEWGLVQAHTWWTEHRHDGRRRRATQPIGQSIAVELSRREEPSSSASAPLSAVDRGN